MRMFSGKTRYLLCGLVLLLLLCAAVSACADDVLFPLPLEHATEVDREELGVKKGTKFPVYGAPFDDAWRGAKSKAAVSVAEPFGVLGSAQDDRWLMITYSVDKGSSRIGWIRTPDTLSEEFNCRLAFRLPYRVTRDTILTDDPAQSRREIGKLREGDLVIAMLKLSAGGTDWIYAETEIDGKPVWAFIDSGDLLSVPTFTKFLSANPLEWMVFLLMWLLRETSMHPIPIQDTTNLVKPPIFTTTSPILNSPI